MIESILGGIFINLVSSISKKYNISQTYLIGGLCVFLGFIYIGLKAYSPDLVEHAIKYALEALGVSQALYMSYMKLTK